jgi:hypothetical protein
MYLDTYLSYSVQREGLYLARVCRDIADTLHTTIPRERTSWKETLFFTYTMTITMINHRIKTERSLGKFTRSSVRREFPSQSLDLKREKAKDEPTNRK